MVRSRNAPDCLDKAHQQPLLLRFETAGHGRILLLASRESGARDCFVLPSWREPAIALATRARVEISPSAGSGALLQSPRRVSGRPRCRTIPFVLRRPRGGQARWQHTDREGVARAARSGLVLSLLPVVRAKPTALHRFAAALAVARRLALASINETGCLRWAHCNTALWRQPWRRRLCRENRDAQHPQFTPEAASTPAWPEDWRRWQADAVLTGPHGRAYDRCNKLQGGGFSNSVSVMTSETGTVTKQASCRDDKRQFLKGGGMGRVLSILSATCVLGSALFVGDAFASASPMTTGAITQGEA
jgi:hypothetical protein